MGAEHKGKQLVKLPVGLPLCGCEICTKMARKWLPIDMLELRAQDRDHTDSRDLTDIYGPPELGQLIHLWSEHDRLVSMIRGGPRTKKLIRRTIETGDWEALFVMEALVG